MRNDIKRLIGNLPSESGFKRRMRFHQSWWRAFVLAETPGNHPIRKDRKIGNTILNGRSNNKNFLSDNIIVAVEKTIQERTIAGSGIIEEERLFNNLLSSQPLCFNFFGDMKLDTTYALQFLKCFYPELTKVLDVKFEFAPDEKYTNDNSAFDVAFEVMSGKQRGLFGVECKYTDTFSSREYDKDEYRRIYDGNKNLTFIAPYKEYIDAKFNQLFRNQLMAEALIQDEKYDFVCTGLFCHHKDNEARKIGALFQSMLKNGKTKFRVITYQEYLENIQRLDLNWAQREISMLLWARYCGDQLSSEAFG